jgi:hypothetical protein
MGRRGLMVVAAVVAVVAVGGIGFAAFTANAYINGSGQAGTFSLYWGTPSSGTPTYYSGSGSYLTCTVQPVGTTNNMNDTQNFTGAFFAPGDSCSFTATLYDSGNLPGYVTETGMTCTGTGCGTGFSWSDNIGSSMVPIAPGSPVTFMGTLTLSSTATLQNSQATFSITITGTAT